MEGAFEEYQSTMRSLRQPTSSELKYALKKINSAAKEKLDQLSNSDR